MVLRTSILSFKAGRTSSRKSATPLSTTAKKNAKRVQVSEKEREAAAAVQPAEPVDTPPDSTVETEEQFHAKVWNYLINFNNL